MQGFELEIALLTDRRYTAMHAPKEDWYLGNILQDDGLLQKALQERGISSIRVDWSNPDVDWARFRAAVFRTTWDYFDRFPEFMEWLHRASQQTRLINSLELVRWNLDKHYLADLQSRGICVVDSAYLETDSNQTVDDLLRVYGWNEAVIKPCVSGAARHTYRVNTENAQEVQQLIHPLLRHEAFLLQPFQQDIINTGEDTLMVINGQFTHAVRKIAKRGDFRVQDDHGGTVHRYEPTPEQVAFAELTIARCPQKPRYGRVDMIRNNQGHLAIMEVELIEPELWLRFHPPAAEVFADAIETALRT